MSWSHKLCGPASDVANILERERDFYQKQLSNEDERSLHERVVGVLLSACANMSTKVVSVQASGSYNPDNGAHCLEVSVKEASTDAEVHVLRGNWPDGPLADAEPAPTAKTPAPKVRPSNIFKK